MEPANDPYPVWYIYHASILKLFPTKVLKPYINMDYAKKVVDILKARSQILQKYGLKAVWVTDAPEVLPEAFFRDHPKWRGPRVDQLNRSRTARFAADVDRPAVLRLYRKSMHKLIKKLPVVDTFYLRQVMLVQDSVGHRAFILVQMVRLGVSIGQCGSG